MKYQSKVLRIWGKMLHFLTQTQSLRQFCICMVFHTVKYQCTQHTKLKRWAYKLTSEHTHLGCRAYVYLYAGLSALQQQQYTIDIGPGSPPDTRQTCLWITKHFSGKASPLWMRTVADLWCKQPHMQVVTMAMPPTRTWQANIICHSKTFEFPFDGNPHIAGHLVSTILA